jgi:hypothetical protein
VQIVFPIYYRKPTDAESWLSENFLNDRMAIGLVSKECFVFLDYLEAPIIIPRQTAPASLIVSLQSKRIFLAIFQQKSLNRAVILCFN